MNVHDVAVVATAMAGVSAMQMLAMAERMAVERGAVKLTMEVLSGNAPAMDRQRLGFRGYQLDPAMGTAQFMQKLLEDQPGLPDSGEVYLPSAPA